MGTFPYFLGLVRPIFGGSGHRGHDFICRCRCRRTSGSSPCTPSGEHTSCDPFAANLPTLPRLLGAGKGKQAAGTTTATVELSTSLCVSLSLSLFFPWTAAAWNRLLQTQDSSHAHRPITGGPQSQLRGRFGWRVSSVCVASPVYVVIDGHMQS